MRKEYFKAFFGINPSAVRKRVIISPIVFPKQFEKITGEQGKHYKSILSYHVANFKRLTFVKAPMTQSAVADIVQLLKLTKCCELVFIGAIGGLDKGLKVGDTVIAGRAKYIYSVGSIHEETKARMLALKKKGIIGIDFENRAFFRAAKKTGLKPMACYVVTDLPLTKPFYRKMT
ncbi:MAG: hypothetical protein KJ732_00760, partial [Candidatus Margulisbacteria bacterium]|nr:hypothetical protein [Candidatus Margulisiibacteriota bacterium]